MQCNTLYYKWPLGMKSLISICLHQIKYTWEKSGSWILFCLHYLPHLTVLVHRVELIYLYRFENAGKFASTVLNYRFLMSGNFFPARTAICSSFARIAISSRMRAFVLWLKRQESLSQIQQILSREGLHAPKQLPIWFNVSPIQNKAQVLRLNREENKFLR